MHEDFQPTRAAGLNRLAAFAPFMGGDYTQGRNYDTAASCVSHLSPYLRHRLVLEPELVEAALQSHGADMPGKFIQEVLWRAYWKGWLEHHPFVWHAYRHEAEALQARLAADAALRAGHQAAVEGRTGIACFDAWARELVTYNWLHNHARMWFASIWIFTLRLPWQLGAAFFLRHLLDGDPASNTLSWRWVAGLHGSGKPYVATAENIARFTEGRFSPAGQLNENPLPLAEDHQPPLVTLPHSHPLPVGDVVLLVHEDDCAPETLDLGQVRPHIIAKLVLRHRETASPVADFAAAACDDAAKRAASFFNCGPSESVNKDNLSDWASKTNLPIIMAYPPVGPVADELAQTGLRPHHVTRHWDQTIWPYTQRGFFYLRKRLPKILPLALAG
jgi:deoxyribodipyrimidine photo-lyase